MRNLKLRKTTALDFEAVHKMMSEYDVVKMTGRWPWPPEPDFTMSRLVTPQVVSGAVSAIVLDEQYIGQVSVVNGELGYMLDKRFWGQGIATWAVREKLDMVFADPDIGQVTAEIWADNKGSAAVLRKVGFTKSGESEELCAPRGTVQLGYDFRLTRAGWARAQPIDLQTRRLNMQALTLSDAGDLSHILSDPNVAWMMGSISNPFTKADAQQWIVERMGPKELGCFAKVALKDGTTIGFVRLSVGRLSNHKADFSIGYAIGKDFGGQGYATEALQAFLDKYMKVYALKSVSAGVMSDNPASIRILEKLGFAKTGEHMHLVRGRHEPAPLWRFALTR